MHERQFSAYFLVLLDVYFHTILVQNLRKIIDRDLNVLGLEVVFQCLVRLFAAISYKPKNDNYKVKIIIRKSSLLKIEYD